MMQHQHLHPWLVFVIIMSLTIILQAYTTVPNQCRMIQSCSILRSVAQQKSKLKLQWQCTCPHSRIILRQKQVLYSTNDDHDIDNVNLRDDHDRQQKDETKNISKSRRILRRLRKLIQRTTVSLYFTTFLLFSRPTISTAAVAPTKASKETIKPLSLRPGMSKTQVEAIEEGDTSILQQLEQSSSSIFQSETGSLTSTTMSNTKNAFSEYGDSSDDGESDLDDENDDIELLQLINDESFTSSGTKRTITQTDKAIGEKLRESTQDQFAAYYKPKTFGLQAKVGIAFFLPTYGFMIGREYVRRRREERYVKKGLEILEAQKAEYFNITNTNNDVDVEDALKNLKNNTTNTDNDDDDDDDDEDDDDDDDDVPPPTSNRRPPRKPLGDPPKSGSGGSGNSNSNGGGSTKPSAADIDKLNKLLGKS